MRNRHFALHEVPADDPPPQHHSPAFPHGSQPCKRIPHCRPRAQPSHAHRSRNGATASDSAAHPSLSRRPSGQGRNSARSSLCKVTAGGSTTGSRPPLRRRCSSRQSAEAGSPGDKAEDGRQSRALCRALGPLHELGVSGHGACGVRRR